MAHSLNGEVQQRSDKSCKLLIVHWDKLYEAWQDLCQKTSESGSCHSGVIFKTGSLPKDPQKIFSLLMPSQMSILS